MLLFFEEQNLFWADAYFFGPCCSLTNYILEWHRISESASDGKPHSILTDEAHLRRVLNALESSLNHPIKPRTLLLGVLPKRAAQAETFINSIIAFLKQFRSVHERKIDPTDSRTSLDDDIIPKLESKTAIVLHEIENLSGSSPLTLQVISDEDSAPAMDAMIVLTTSVTDDDMIVQAGNIANCEASLKK